MEFAFILVPFVVAALFAVLGERVPIRWVGWLAAGVMASLFV